MRRTLAPSQLQGGASNKKAKFSTPFASTKNVVGSLNSAPSAPALFPDCEQESPTKLESASGERSTEDILRLLSCAPDPDLKAKSGFKTGSRTNVALALVEPKVQMPTIVENRSGLAPIFFSVVWGKVSTRKHKKWEGDGVLEVRGRTLVLRDMNAKEIGKMTGCKQAIIEGLGEGQHVQMGGKEVELLNGISVEEYNTGRCFSGGDLVCDGPLLVDKKPKPFINALAAGQFAGHRAVLSGPRHDPTLPNALVMPRPITGQSGGDILDVVVDPRLCLQMRSHQNEGVLFLYECVMGLKTYNGQGAILADEMGLGKTLQCIALIWTLLKQGPFNGRPVCKRVLVVTPSSLVKNWMKEFKKWLGSERLNVFAVDQSNNVDLYLKTLTNYPVLLVSYEMFVRYHERLTAINFDLIVCDEGHRLKNNAIKTSSLLAKINTTRRVILTGTPVQNDLQEFFSLIDFCNPNLLGNLATFRRVYEDPIVKSKQPDASDAERELGECRSAELQRITSQFILRRTQEVNAKYLPPKREYMIFCAPTDLQLILYRHLLGSRLLRSCLSGAIAHDGSGHLVCLEALRKLCNHPMINHKSMTDKAECGTDKAETESLYSGMENLFPAEYRDSTRRRQGFEEHSGKMKFLRRLLGELFEEQNRREKIVIVSLSTKCLNLLQNLCDSYNWSYLRLDGSTPTSKRQELVDRFNSPHCSEVVFLLSSKAGGVGLNLIGASRILLYDVDWNPANDLQAMARVWRDGQKRPVHIYRLFTTGTIEEKIFQRQITKQSLSGTVVDSKEARKSHFTRDELKDLFSLRENLMSDTHELLHCDCLVAEAGERTSNHSTNKENKNLSMAELMDWDHMTIDGLVASENDGYLAKAVLNSNVTFCMINSNNSVIL